MKNGTFLAIASMFFLCSCGVIGNIPFPGQSPPTYYKPSNVVGWMAGRAALDYRGANTHNPVGMKGLDDGRYAIVGVPNHNRGCGYVDTLVAADLKIMRTTETCYDPGKSGNMWGYVDLGRILREFITLDQPGEFLRVYIDSTRFPGHYIGLNVEYNITATYPDGECRYPITMDDYHLAQIWNMNIKSEQGYVKFRCRQFATIIRLMGELAKKKFGDEYNGIIIYGGYGEKFSVFKPWQKSGYTTGSLASEYGLDWTMMAQPMSFNNIQLTPIKYGMCAWFKDVELPIHVQRWVEHAHEKLGLHVLHDIQFPGDHETDDGLIWRAQIKDRLDNLLPGNGLATVAVRPVVWTKDDDRLAREIDRAYRIRGW